MEGRRGGRVQVTVLQFIELTKRVEKLEALLARPVKAVDVKDGGELTKNDIKEMLDHKSISYTTRDTREDLLALLNKEVNKCQ